MIQAHNFCDSLYEGFLEDIIVTTHFSQKNFKEREGETFNKSFNISLYEDFPSKSSELDRVCDF